MSQLAEFIGNHIFLSMTFLVVLFFYISLLLNEKMQKFSHVNPAQLTQLVNQKGAVLVDVRPPEHFAQGHIANAINMPLSDLTEGKASLSKLKNKTVVAYCARGQSSLSACKFLTNNGVESVFNLNGGVNSWITEKLPLVKK